MNTWPNQGVTIASRWGKKVRAGKATATRAREEALNRRQMVTEVPAGPRPRLRLGTSNPAEMSHCPRGNTIVTTVTQVWKTWGTTKKTNGRQNAKPST